ncbi:MAG TPA: hypothetical protein VFP53_02835, partial [Sphingomicrobium sp.]|nr:hypothetical protein [Sphingomicrobium sp.]
FRNKPIIAIAREDSDAGRLIRRHNLGIASFDPAKIGAFIEAVDNSGWPGARDLEELTADSQFARFVDLAEQCVLERACE